jgi:hypothetical protein
MSSTVSHRPEDREREPKMSVIAMTTGLECTTHDVGTAGKAEIKSVHVERGMC